MQCQRDHEHQSLVMRVAFEFFLTLKKLLTRNMQTFANSSVEKLERLFCRHLTIFFVLGVESSGHSYETGVYISIIALDD